MHQWNVLAFRAGAVMVFSALLASNIHAKDAIQASINVPASGCTAPDAVVHNGTGLSSGTYAEGTIHLLYVVNASQFSAGELSCFDLGLQNIRVNSNNLPNYAAGITLNVEQGGGSNLVLSLAQSTFPVAGTGTVGETRVIISIPAHVPENPSLNVDGAELVTQLQLSAAPPGSKLDTVTTIVVKVVLAVPSSCLTTYHSVLNNDTTLELSELQVNIPTNGSKAGKVAGSVPGVILDSVLVVNACGASVTFDEKLLLPATYFGWSGSNAVFTYTKLGATSVSGVLATPVSESPQGQTSCLAGITLPANTALLTTAKLKITDGVASGALPAADPGFFFSAELRTPAETPCAGSLLDSGVVTPNPVNASLPFSIK